MILGPMNLQTAVACLASLLLIPAAHFIGAAIVNRKNFK